MLGFRRYKIQMKNYDKAPHTGTLVDDLLAKVDETLAESTAKLEKAKRITEKPNEEALPDVQA